MNRHRFGSPPAEICGDLRESQRQNLLFALRFREGRGGRCRVAAGRAMVTGGRRDNGQEAAIAGWSWRSVVLVAAGMARRPRPRPAVRPLSAAPPPVLGAVAVHGRCVACCARVVARRVARGRCACVVFDVVGDLH